MFRHIVCRLFENGASIMHLLEFQYPPIAEQKPEIPEIPVVLEKIVDPVGRVQGEDDVPIKLLHVVASNGGAGKVQIPLE